MNLTIHNAEPFPAAPDQIRSFVRWVDSNAELPGTISVVLVDADEIARWNREHRNREGPTDVLSYRYEEQDQGEILLCSEVIDEMVQERETAGTVIYWEVLLHGLLHLAGYDHEQDDGEHLERQNSLLTAWLNRAGVTQ